MQDRGNNVSRMYHAKRKLVEVKSWDGYQLLPLQSANNAAISIKRMQTHLAVDCCQVQVDVLSRNVTTSSRFRQHIFHTRGGMSQKSMREIKDLPGGG